MADWKRTQEISYPGLLFENENGLLYLYST
jgi:hypothetical protein